jgi:hypothetical protein
VGEDESDSNVSAWSTFQEDGEETGGMDAEPMEDED